MISQSTGRIAGFLRSAGSILIAAIICYGAWPYYSAEMLRQALQRGDVNYVHQKIDWRSLKISVKGTISGLLLGRTGHAPAVFGTDIGTNLMPNMIDNMVDRVLTPSGLIKAYQKFSQSSDLNGKSVLKYVRWAFFTNPTRFEVEVEPGQPTDPSAVVVFELVNFDWVATKMFIKTKEENQGHQSGRHAQNATDQKPYQHKNTDNILSAASDGKSNSNRILEVLKITKQDWLDEGVTKKLLTSNMWIGMQN